MNENTACGLCYTSGTTGDPKGVLYSHRSNTLLAMMAAQSSGLSMGPKDRLLAVVPMFHANGWGIPFITAMLGASLEASFIAGGMPWFVAPFGRDSILAALQSLPFDARPAEGIARLFAAYQGARDAKRTGELFSIYGNLAGAVKAAGKLEFLAHFPVEVEVVRRGE